MKRILFCSLLFPGILWCYLGDTSLIRKDSALDPGRELAEKYCASCHLLPGPELLDKSTWTEQVLPNMGARLGIRHRGYDPYDGVDPEELEQIRQLGVYPDPELAALSEAEWEAIVNYYQTNAPEELPEPEVTTPVSPSPPPFKLKVIEIGEKLVPQVTLLEYDDAKRILFIGDHLQLYAMTQWGSIVGTWQTQTPSSDIALTEQGIFLLSIGQFKPSEKKEGVFFPLTLNDEGVDPADLVVTELPRPVDFSIGDLNADGKEDVVICGFGNHQGRLAWYNGMDAEKEHVLSGLPGARRAVIRDMNADGLNDIVVLMAQAWEQLTIYYNEGNGQFREEKILELPAIYGSSYFELADLNGDGHPDILLTNGDNWDYSSVRKPYHGLRIYLNDGTNRFTPAYFFPMYGCSEARAVDFDRDGDLDIAAIAFYDDRQTRPDKSFVYLENDGQMNFTASYMNETAYGKWLSMDVGDFDGDGYSDVFLGSYFHNISELSKMMTANTDSFPEVLLLTFKP